MDGRVCLGCLSAKYCGDVRWLTGWQPAKMMDKAGWLLLQPVDTIVIGAFHLVAPTLNFERYLAVTSQTKPGKLRQCEWKGFKIDWSYSNTYMMPRLATELRELVESETNSKRRHSKLIKWLQKKKLLRQMRVRLCGQLCMVSLFLLHEMTTYKLLFLRTHFTALKI